MGDGLGGRRRDDGCGCGSVPPSASMSSALRNLEYPLIPRSLVRAFNSFTVWLSIVELYTGTFSLTPFQDIQISGFSPGNLEMGIYARTPISLLLDSRILRNKTYCLQIYRVRDIINCLMSGTRDSSCIKRPGFARGGYSRVELTGTLELLSCVPVYILQIQSSLLPSSSQAPLVTST